MPSRRSMVFWKYMCNDPLFWASDLCVSCNMEDLGIRHVKINHDIFIANLGVPMIFRLRWWHQVYLSGLIVYLLLAIFYCILLCSFHCEVHEHAKHMTFTTSSGVFSKRCIFCLDKAWKSTTIFWKMIKNPTEIWVFRKPTGLLKNRWPIYFQGQPKTADSVWFGLVKFHSDLTRVLGPQMVV